MEKQSQSAGKPIAMENRSSEKHLALAMEKHSCRHSARILTNHTTVNARKEFSHTERIGFCPMQAYRHTPRSMRSYTLLVPTLLWCLVPKCRESPAPINTATDAKKHAIVRAAEFLLNQQRTDGAFFSTGQQGDDSPVASTGYAMLALQQAQKVHALPEEKLHKARSFLLQQQGDNFFWRYKPFLPGDLDDTAAAIGALAHGGAISEPKSIRAVENIFALQNRDGSLPTWLVPVKNAKAPTANTTFPTKGDAEVTAFFLWVIGDHKQYGKAIEAAEKFILRAQRRDGLFDSAWYRNALYATYRVQQFLHTYREKSPQAMLASNRAAHAAAAWLNASARKENLSSNLDRAFALSILQWGWKKEKFCAQYAPRLQDLLRSQNADGSWLAEPLFLTEIGQKSAPPHERKYITSSIYTTALMLEVLAQWECE